MYLSFFFNWFSSAWLARPEKAPWNGGHGRSTGAPRQLCCSWPTKSANGRGEWLHNCFSRWQVRWKSQVFASMEEYAEVRSRRCFELLEDVKADEAGNVFRREDGRLVHRASSRTPLRHRLTQQSRWKSADIQEEDALFSGPAAALLCATPNKGLGLGTNVFIRYASSLLHIAAGSTLRSVC